MVFIPRWERYKEKPSHTNGFEVDQNNHFGSRVTLCLPFVDGFEDYSSQDINMAALDNARVINGEAQVGRTNSNRFDTLGRVKALEPSTISLVTRVAREAPSIPTPKQLIQYGTNNTSPWTAYGFESQGTKSLKFHCAVNGSYKQTYLIDIVKNRFEKVNIMGVYDGAQLLAYRDGVIKDSLAASGALSGMYHKSNMGLAIGSNPNASSGYSANLDYVYIFSDTALSADEHSELIANPYQLIRPRRRWYFLSSQPVLGDLSSIEAVDTGAWVGSVPVLGGMASQEAVDTGSWVGSGLVSGSFTGQEAVDTGSWVGSVLVSGSFTGQEVVDTGAWVGSVTHAVTGVIGGTDSADVIFLMGGALITGGMNVVDGQDTALFSTRDLVRIRARFNTTLARDKQFEVQV